MAEKAKKSTEKFSLNINFAERAAEFLHIKPNIFTKYFLTFAGIFLTLLIFLGFSLMLLVNNYTVKERTDLLQQNVSSITKTIEGTLITQDMNYKCSRLTQMFLFATRREMLFSAVKKRGQIPFSGDFRRVVFTIIFQSAVISFPPFISREKLLKKQPLTAQNAMLQAGRFIPRVK